jgi:hypothetical protein
MSGGILMNDIAIDHKSIMIDTKNTMLALLFTVFPRYPAQELGDVAASAEQA